MKGAKEVQARRHHTDYYGVADLELTVVRAYGRDRYGRLIAFLVRARNAVEQDHSGMSIRLGLSKVCMDLLAHVHSGHDSGLLVFCLGRSRLAARTDSLKRTRKVARGGQGRHREQRDGEHRC